MGGTQSCIDDFIKYYGVDELFKLVLIKKKISWLEEICIPQIDQRLDDEIKYILHKVDQTANFKKYITIGLYKQKK